jgi:hypothetical protein
MAVSTNESPDNLPVMMKTELHLRVIEARGLLAVDSSGTSDPLVALLPSNNPQNFGDDSLHIDMYACNAIRRDQKIGEVEISSRALC